MPQRVTGQGHGGPDHIEAAPEDLVALLDEAEVVGPSPAGGVSLGIELAVEMHVDAEPAGSEDPGQLLEPARCPVGEDEEGHVTRVPGRSGDCWLGHGAPASMDSNGVPCTAAATSSKFAINCRRSSGRIFRIGAVSPAGGTPRNSCTARRAGPSSARESS